MALSEIPIFPLAQVVLFPQVSCPLHLFEPRYREMAAAALDGEKRIGMVTVLPDHVGAMEGDPPVFEIGCEGHIVESEVLADGRVNIVLQGTQRFRILDEPAREAGRLFRVARIQPLEDALDPGEAAAVTALRNQTLEKLATLVQRVSGGERRFDPDVLSAMDDTVAINTLCQALDLEPAEKQGLLQNDRVHDRLKQLSDLLDFRLAHLSSAPSEGSPTVH